MLFLFVCCDAVFVVVCLLNLFLLLFVCCDAVFFVTSTVTFHFAQREKAKEKRAALTIESYYKRYREVSVEWMSALCECGVDECFV